MLFRGVQGMRESDTYLAILDEGALKHTRELVLRLGQKKFGPPPDALVKAVQGISGLEGTAEQARAELERLERLLERVLDVSSWQELLQLP
jgi:hypothetical protein